MFSLYPLVMLIVIGGGICAGLVYLVAVWLLLTDPASDLTLTIWRRK